MTHGTPAPSAATARPRRGQQLSPRHLARVAMGVERRGRRRRAPLHTRIRYAFDNSLARGPLALVLWLFVAALVVVLLGAVAVNLLQVNFAGGKDGSLLEDLWQSLLRSFSSDVFANDVRWPARLIGLGVTISGIFLAGALIGIIAQALDQRIQQLRKGRSVVLERGHTLVLGWSPRLPTILRELVVANENQRDPVVVVLAPRDKLRMEDDVERLVGDTGRTRVVCRSGNPSRPADLELVNLAEARSVLVLAGEGGDADVVTALLAVMSLDPELRGAPVVVELADCENAHTVRTVTEGAVTAVTADDVVAEVTAQACHQPGLSAVFRDLLSFDGEEVYFAEVPQLVGHTYGQALLGFATSALIGRCSADGLVELNPPMDAVFAPGDRVVAVSRDDDTVVFGGVRAVPAPVPARPDDGGEDPVRVLIVGWSRFGPKVVRELDEFLAPGSHITVFVDSDLADPSALTDEPPEHATLRVFSTSAGPEGLLRLRGEQPFDQVVVLGYRDALSVADADARTLLTLLTLRQAWPAGGERRARVIAELLDQSHVDIAVASGVDDFIVSDALASLMLAQLSERAELQAVFDDLFDVGGAVLELQPAWRFVPDAPVRFVEVVAAGAARGTSVIGWRTDDDGRVVLNPHKDETVHLGERDQVLLVGLRAG